MFFEILFTLGLVAVVLGLGFALVVAWLWAAGDLFWMAVLKPYLIGIPFVVVLGLTMALVCAVMPAESRVGLCLPILIAVHFATLVTRWLADPLARWEFSNGWGDYGFDMDPGDLDKATFFLLIRGRQKARYSPPDSKPRGE